MLIRGIALVLIVSVPVRCQFFPANLNYNLDAYTPTNDDLCDEQLLEFYTSMISGELWALELFDTWGKVQSGVFEGNLFNMGLSQKCKSFRRKDEDDPSSVEFRGKHCLVGLEPLKGNSSESSLGGINLGMIGDALEKVERTMAHGVCLPASCSNKKIVQFLSRFLKKANVKPIGAQCNTDERRPFGSVDYAAASMAATLTFLLISSTLYDLRKRRSDAKPNSLLAAFSLYTNGQKLFQTTSVSSSTIRCFFGFRALSTIWIILLHRIFIEAGTTPLKNPAELLTLLDRWYSWIVIGCTFAVDTFFVMGGVLVTMSLMRKFEKKTFNYARFMLHRYLRYAPIVAALTLLLSPAIKLANDHSLEMLKQNCQERWWHNLLMISNYFDQEYACLGHFWYLSADFQLYAVSPLVVYCLWKFSWKSFSTLPLIVASSSMFVTYSCRKSGGSSDVAFIPQGIYFATHTRMGPWIIGIMLGFVLFRFRDEKCQISGRMTFLLWSLAAIFLWAPIYFRVVMIRSGDHIEIPGNAIFMGLKRQIWALGVAWIIFACHKLESGGFIRWLLCLDIWQLMSKLALSIYAFHMIYVTLVTLQRKDIISFDVTNIFHSALGDIMAMLPIGCLSYLTFEAPVQVIEKYFKKRPQASIEITGEDSKEVTETTTC